MIKFAQHSGIFTLTAHQLVHTSLDDAWSFFSNPMNLPEITPQHMGFHITSELADQMYPGQIISYKINVLPGISTNWVTEITHIKEKKFFVDEQRYGPYSMWHHEHHFEETKEGILMTDKISYKLPFGILGKLFHPFFIKPQLTNIFNYRQKKLDSHFHQEKIGVH